MRKIRQNQWVIDKIHPLDDPIETFNSHNFVPKTLMDSSDTLNLFSEDKEMEKGNSDQNDSFFMESKCFIMIVN